MNKYIITIILSLVFSLNFAQVSIHSHNDYEQEIPFWDAYAHGANSIEADIFLKDNQLFVAHELDKIKQQNTLEKLYLKPIKQIYEDLTFQPRPLQLLIDIKSESISTLQKLISTLKPYQKYLYPHQPDGIKIIISGNKPSFQAYAQYPDYIFFDWQDISIPSEISKIGMMSLDFKEFSKWNGKGRLNLEDENQIKNVIHLAKKRKIPFRFWGNPDTESGWYTLQKLGIDYIGTDHPAKVEAYLYNLEKNTVEISCDEENYQPTYQSDNYNKKVKNVILIIGDGMGLAQISTATIFCEDMMLNKFKHIGFSKTSSANDYTTDSAAGGTAIAIGEKTNNRAIGVDAAYQTKPNLTEILSDYGFKTAILTTDEITGATPADFYAHVNDRGMKDKIAQDLINSDLDFWMGGDRKYFREKNLNTQLTQKGFTIVDTLDDLNPLSKKIAFLAGESSLPYVRNGRGNLLADATTFALNYLKNDSFFMMIEGAQIDNYGHFNDLKGVAEETIDLDKAIQRAIAFADKQGETLVIVTADHECGGLTMPHGEMKYKELEGEFSTHDHTGIMVPVLAYGPHSSEFQGIYDNTEIFHKILKILNLKNQ